MPKPALDAASLCHAAAKFAEIESSFPEPTLFGVTDGKAIGTYAEHKFKAYLALNFEYDPGNSAEGIDFPSVATDMKVTSLRQPQSSSPYRSARQKVYGLGYNLLVLVYDKKDEPTTVSATLNFVHTIFVEARRTADFQMTRGLRKIIENNGNVDDIVAFMHEKDLKLDYDIEAPRLAQEILVNKPEQGYLTMSNALQWRLQYGRVIECAGQIDGVVRVR